MWSKNVLSISYFALLAGGIDAIPNNYGLKRAFVAEGVRSPVLFRRGQPFRNETQSLDTVQASSTISTIIISSVDESSVTLSLESSSVPAVVTSQASISLLHPTKTSSTTSLSLGTLLEKSNHVSPISTANDRSETSTLSMTHEQRLSDVTSITSILSSYDTTSESRTSALSSSAPSSSGHGSLTDGQPASGSQTVVFVSGSIPSTRTTPTPASTVENSWEILSTRLRESSSQHELQHSEVLLTGTLPPVTFNTLRATSSGSQPPEPLATAVLTVSSNRLLAPTPSVEIQPAAPSTSSRDATTISGNNEAIASRSNMASESPSLSTVQPLAPSVLSSNLTPGLSTVDAAPSSQTHAPGPSNVPFSNSIPVSESHMMTQNSPSSVIVAVSTTLTGIFFSSGSGLGISPSETAAPSNAWSSSESSIGAVSSLLPESGLSISTLSAMTTSNMALNRPEAISTASLMLNSTINSINSQNVVQTARASSSNIEQSNSPVLLPTVTPAFESTMLAPSQSLPDTTKSLFGWTNTSSLSTAELGIMRGGSASPTDIVSTHNRTQAGGLQTTLIPDPRTSTSRNLTFVETTSASITSASNLITATFLPSSTETSLATLILYGPGYGSTKSLSATPSSTSTIAAAPPPPLTTSQTAGVAVGSTAGVLLAIVAAIFIARRYHARAAARRKSTGSVYPKVAYLYDPVNRGDDGDSASAFMAGGADGLPPNGHPPTVPQNSPNPSQRYSNSFMNRFSDPGNPFRDPEDPVQELHDSARDSLLTPTDAATAFAAAISGYAVAAQDLPATSRYSAPQPLYDHIIPSPTLSPFLAQHNFRHSRTRSLSRNGFDSNTSKRTINTNMSANTAGMEDVPLSPYGMQASHTLPPINELPTNDPEADSFEYDLLMPVDTQTETPDSVIVYVPPQTPRTSINPMFQSNLPVGYNTTKSRLSAVPAQSPRSPQMQLRAKASVGSNSTLSQTERFSLAYDSRNSTTYIRPSSNAVSPKNSAPTVSPVSPLPTPVHRGWDEIKRYSNGSGKLSPLVASPLPNFSPPLPSFNPPPVKKRSLIQLRRKDPVLAGTGQVVMPSTGNPLTVKIPFESKKGAEFEAPRMSLLAKLNNMGEERRAEGGSPGSLTASDSVYSNDSATQKKTAKHVDFAHTKLSR